MTDEQTKDWRTLCDELTALTAERDQALARVDALNAANKILSDTCERWHAENQKAEARVAELELGFWDEAHQRKADARVAVLREAIKNGIECCEPSRVDGILSRAIHGEDQAAEALLARITALEADLGVAVARVKELEADKDDVARRLIRMETGG